MPSAPHLDGTWKPVAILNECACAAIAKYAEPIYSVGTRRSGCSAAICGHRRDRVIGISGERISTERAPTLRACCADDQGNCRAALRASFDRVVGQQIAVDDRDERQRAGVTNRHFVEHFADVRKAIAAVGTS